MLLVLALVASLACVAPPQDIAEQITLPYDKFDSQSGPNAWRSMSSAGCTDAAIALLQAFQSSNESNLTDDQRREIAFHIGQTLAFAGRENEAIEDFERANKPGGSVEWHTYVDATLAFLRHDTDALVAAHKSYAAIAPGSMRLSAIEGFIKCPKDPYAKAIHCAMAM
jgi:hypothetical protein